MDRIGVYKPDGDRKTPPAPPKKDRPATGAERIAAERQRQIEEEGWTTEHDAEHTDESLAMAAACYATPQPLLLVERDRDGYGYMQMTAEDPWPWKDVWPDGSKSNAWDKRGEHDRIRQLEIAGALIAAEIDRLLAVQKQD